MAIFRGVGGTGSVDLTDLQQVALDIDSNVENATSILQDVDNRISDFNAVLDAGGFVRNDVPSTFTDLTGFSLTLNDELKVGRKISHLDDPDTFIEFPTNNFMRFIIGSNVSLDISAGFALFRTPLTASQGIQGDLTGDVTGNVVGNVTGNVTGNVVGNVTGDLIGNFVTTDEVNLDAGYGSQAPIFGVRAWGNVSSTGALLAGGNIASVTQTSIGTYSIQFSSSMPDSNYAVTATLNKTASDEVVTVTAKSTTGFIVQCFDVSLGGRENNNFMFTVVR